MKDNWLNKLMVAAGLFAILIIIGLLTMRKPAVRYKLTEKEALASVTSPGDQLSIDKANKLIKTKNSEYLFIDIRTPYEFIKGHFDGAVNIPLSNLFSEENYKLLKQADHDKKSLVLYGNDQSQANAPWMLLKQIGFTKVLILQGGYAYANIVGSVIADSTNEKKIDAEIARYNYAEMVKGTTEPKQVPGSISIPQKVTTTPKPKSTAPAAGGC
jgi:rhodanese-related sulfurtransferase